MFYELMYFAKADSICAEDFNNEVHTDFINLSLVSSLTKPIKFNLPFSGGLVNEYSVLTMSNRDRYFISTHMYVKLSKVLIADDKNSI